MCKDNSVFDRWCGKGWYTVTCGYGEEDFTSEGAVWIEDADILADLVACAKNTHEPEYVQSEYHGNDVLPDECLSDDPNDWVDVDDAFLTESDYRKMCDLTQAKADGDETAMRVALEALGK